MYNNDCIPREKSVRAEGRDIWRSLPMSYLKKFTDILLFVGIFGIFVYVFGQYMAFTPEETVSTTEKLKLFFSEDVSKNYRPYILMILLMCLSFAVNRLLPKLPALNLAFASLPLIFVFNMFSLKQLYNKFPALYIIVCILNVFGCLYECISRDREDGGRRTLTGSCGVGLLAFGADCAVLYAVRKYALLFDIFMAGELSEKENKVAFALKRFGINILRETDDAELKAIKVLAVMLAVGIAVSVILRGAYFIDLAAAAIPFGYAVFMWNKGILVKAPMFVLIPTCIYFICRLAAALSCTPREGRRTKPPREVS